MRSPAVQRIQKSALGALKSRLPASAIQFDIVNRNGLGRSIEFMHTTRIAGRDTDNPLASMCRTCRPSHRR